MSETASYMGPLDIVRRINSDAEELDELTAQYIYENDSEDGAELGRLVAELDARHPLIGHEVIIYGQELTPSMGQDRDMYPLSFGVTSEEMPSAEYTPVIGTYNGFNIMPAYDQISENIVQTVAHMIKINEAGYFDDNFNYQKTVYYSYVWIVGSEVTPVLPLQAHSFQDLNNDWTLEKFNRLAYNDTSPAELIYNVGKLANEIFFNDEAQADMNHQLVSYINTLGLLNGVVLTSSDGIVADRNGYAIGGEEPSGELVEQTTFQAEMFDILPGYLRFPDGTMQLGGAPELYVTTTLEDDRSLLFPVKNIDHTQ